MEERLLPFLDEKVDSKDKVVRKEDDQKAVQAYFDCYGMHRQQINMLSDHVRTELFRLGVVQHREEAFRNKVVMDMGAGTGILGFFALKFGNANFLYSIEPSSMNETIATIAAANRFQNRMHVAPKTLESVIGQKDLAKHLQGIMDNRKLGTTGICCHESASVGNASTLSEAEKARLRKSLDDKVETKKASSSYAKAGSDLEGAWQNFLRRSENVLEEVEQRSAQKPGRVCISAKFVEGILLEDYEKHKELIDTQKRIFSLGNQITEQFEREGKSRLLKSYSAQVQSAREAQEADNLYWEYDREGELLMHTVPEGLSSSAATGDKKRDDSPMKRRRVDEEEDESPTKLQTLVSFRDNLLFEKYPEVLDMSNGTLSPNLQIFNSHLMDLIADLEVILSPEKGEQGTTSVEKFKEFFERKLGLIILFIVDDIGDFKSNSLPDKSPSEKVQDPDLSSLIIDMLPCNGDDPLQDHLEFIRQLCRNFRDSNFAGIYNTELYSDGFLYQLRKKIISDYDAEHWEAGVRHALAFAACQGEDSRLLNHAGVSCGVCNDYRLGLTAKAVEDPSIPGIEKIELLLKQCFVPDDYEKYIRSIDIDTVEHDPVLVKHIEGCIAGLKDVVMSNMVAAAEFQQAEQATKNSATNSETRQFLSLFDFLPSILPGKVHSIISECIGTCLVNERMFESFLKARDNFLLPSGLVAKKHGHVAPGGTTINADRSAATPSDKGDAGASSVNDLEITNLGTRMHPETSRICVAPFSDERIHDEIDRESLFWMNQTPLIGSLKELKFDGVAALHRDADFKTPLCDIFSNNSVVMSGVVWDSSTSCDDVVDKNPNMLNDIMSENPATTDSPAKNTSGVENPLSTEEQEWCKLYGCSHAPMGDVNISSKYFDWRSCSLSELENIVIPFEFVAPGSEQAAVFQPGTGPGGVTGYGVPQKITGKVIPESEKLIGDTSFVNAVLSMEKEAEQSQFVNHAEQMEFVTPPDIAVNPSDIVFDFTEIKNSKTSKSLAKSKSNDRASSNELSRTKRQGKNEVQESKLETRSKTEDSKGMNSSLNADNVGLGTGNSNLATMNGSPRGNSAVVSNIVVNKVESDCRVKSLQKTEGCIWENVYSNMGKTLNATKTSFVDDEVSAATALAIATAVSASEAAVSGTGAATEAAVSCTKISAAVSDACSKISPPSDASPRDSPSSCFDILQLPEDIDVDDFESQFEIIYPEDSYGGPSPSSSLAKVTKVHGLLMWFDCGFGEFRSDSVEVQSRNPIGGESSKCGGKCPLELSTSPWNVPTHWRQMVFPFPDPLILQEGDTVKGELTMVATEKLSYKVHIRMERQHTLKVSAKSYNYGPYNLLNPEYSIQARVAQRM